MFLKQLLLFVLLALAQGQEDQKKVRRNRGKGGAYYHRVASKGGKGGYYGGKKGGYYYYGKGKGGKKGVCTPSGTGDMPIGEVADSLGSFTILVAALKAAGLWEAINDPCAAYTVFAPTDEAFLMLPDGTIEALLEDIPTLQFILLTHVLNGIIPSAALADLVDSSPLSVGALSEQILTVTVAVDPLAITVAGEGNSDPIPAVIIPDVPASNGIIHAVDFVILPGEAPAATPAPSKGKGKGGKKGGYYYYYYYGKGKGGKGKGGKGKGKGGKGKGGGFY